MTLVRARPIGMMHMVDEGENDEKVICVNLDDPEFRSYEHYTELPEHRLDELRSFFEDYTKLENKEVDVQNFADPDEAIETVSRAIDLYKETYPES
jgi:inorganic pyrophosphatase